MTKDQKKQALAMHVANLSSDAIARALELPLEDVQSVLKIKPTKPAAPIAKPEQPAPVAQPLRTVPLADGGYARVFAGGATIHAPDRQMDQRSEKRKL